MAELPMVRGLFLCETVIVEERTRNISLINCFTRRLVEQFPTSPQRFVLYAVFANGQGIIPIDVRVTDLQDDSVIYERRVAVGFTDPLLQTRFVYRVGSLTFPHPGGYEVSLFVGADPLAATRVEVLPSGGGA